ncbi:protein TANC2-like isoform X2 [Ornithodoros turicata]|uniref:protein TANC2-like isoform X2 n=1 Tax=Ornithodoros turicata TaxID=34597 RepID=UPI00313950EF
MSSMPVQKCFVLFAATTVLWNFSGISFIEPLRRFWKGKKKNPRTVRKMMDELVVGPPATRCPTCQVPFDKGKRRRIIEECGHERCYYCMLNSDGAGCSLCAAEAAKMSNNSARTRLKTNGHFTTFMQTRSPQCIGSPVIPGVASPRASHVSWKERKTVRPSTVSVDSHATFIDLAKVQHWPMNMVRKIKSLWTMEDEPSPHHPPLGNAPAAPTEHLYTTRLGLLLLGDGTPVYNEAPNTGNHSSHSGGSFASVSSLANSDLNMAGSTNTSPISTLTGSSEAEAMSIMRGSSREQSSDSVASLMSTSSSPSPSRRMPFQQRNNSVPNNRRGTLINYSDKTNTLGHGRGGHVQYKIAPQPALKPLFFEVPQAEVDPVFVGRQWLFNEIEQELRKDCNRGVVLVGCPGSGKTATILQLVDYSVFGRKREDVTYSTIGLHYGDTSRMTLSSSNSSSIYQTRASVNQEVARLLGGHVVGYHFCQADNSATCHVPEFVHSIAAQLCQAPQLVAYRDLLLRETMYQDMLSPRACHENPHNALVKGILEPLQTLRQTGRIPNTSCLLVVDALNESELHRPDYGDTITSFLAKHITRFPSWLKMVVTVRTAFQDITRLLPFHEVSLDRISTNDHLMRDLIGYALLRIDSSPAIRANITINNGKQEGSTYTRFSSHLANLSKGCFLYMKLTLDLIEKGHLVVKSSSYKVLPVSLNQVYLLSFNLKFTTTRSYERVQSILQVCMATLTPLQPHELYHSVNAGLVCDPITWPEFQQRLNVLTGAQFLIPRQDNTLMLAHPSLREWLLRREENESTKFLCDIRSGHASIAFRMSRIESPLDPEQLLALGHHILKAHIYKNMGKGLTSACKPRDLQALWVFHSTDNVSAALACLPNTYSPNVSRLLLLSQADPNARTPCLNRAPILMVAAHEGFADMVTSLLDFGADVNAASDIGCTALCMASERGHLDIVKQLLACGARIDHVDSKGQSALAYAAQSGHIKVVSHLVGCNWPDDFGVALGLRSAAQQALIAASMSGHIKVCDFLLDMIEVQVNKQDDFSGHTALTAASLAGHKDLCTLLMSRGASLLVKNNNGEPPLCCAVAEGHWAVTELLLCHAKVLEQTESHGRTALMLAAAEGHIGVLELLLAKGANVVAKDNEGLSALSWACRRGQLQAAQCLLTHDANINHSDKQGRTPLDFAALEGNADVVELLLKHGAEIEHVDITGKRALDKAIASGNLGVINCFLQTGAKIGSQTWEMAAEKPDIVYLLLNKLHQDGVLLYRKGHLKEATHRYQYALKKFQSALLDNDEHGNSFLHLKHQLLLGLAKCKRKLNELDAAMAAASQAIDLRPSSYDGHFVRARCCKDRGYLEGAQRDIEEALRLAPISSLELRRSILRVKEEILSGTTGQSLSESLSSRSDLGLSKLQSVSTDTMDQVCSIPSDSRLNLSVRL